MGNYKFVGYFDSLFFIMFCLLFGFAVMNLTEIIGILIFIILLGYVFDQFSPFERVIKRDYEEESRYIQKFFEILVIVFIAFGVFSFFNLPMFYELSILLFFGLIFGYPLIIWLFDFMNERFDEVIIAGFESLIALIFIVFGLVFIFTGIMYGLIYIISFSILIFLLSAAHKFILEK